MIKLFIIVTAVYIIAVACVSGLAKDVKEPPTNEAMAQAYNVDLCSSSVIDCSNEQESATASLVVPTRGVVEATIRQIAKDEGFDADYLVALSMCESSLNPNAVGDHGHSRGLFQIHNKYQPQVTDAQAFNVEWSTRWTIYKIKNGGKYLWSCANKIL